MQFMSAETSQTFMRRVILPLAGLVVGLVVFAIAGIFWVADYQTNVAIAQQARLASGAFRIQAEKLATSAADYGFWDDAVKALVENPDPAWMSENIGTGAQKSLGAEMSFALDPSGAPIYSYVNGKEDRRNPTTYLGDGFNAAFEVWKSRRAEEAYSGLLPYAGSAVSIAIAPVRSFTHSEQPPTGYSIVFVKIIDPEVLRQLSHDFELANLRVAATDADIADRLAVVTIGDASGNGPATRFAWDPQRPGNGLLKIALPFMGVFLLLLLVLAAVILSYVVASARLITDREAKASLDALTGLANRTGFFSALDQALEQIALGKDCVTVMYVDLDGFKSINDTMGHAAGDELLVQAAARFKACVRENDVVARLGGDEFAIIVSGNGDRSMTQAVGARILVALAEPFDLTAGRAQASCSIGIADCWNRNTRGADLLNTADQALYEAKASGKNAMRFARDAAKAAAGLKVA